MANYYNPYNYIYPMSYQNSAMNQPMMQQPVQQSFSAGPKIMEWVEGEVGAKAYQMPAGWPVNQPIPLWDSTDTVIYLKSWSQMGFPNPLQKIHYTLENQNNMSALPAVQSGEMDQGNSGMSGNNSGNNMSSQYVTKEDLNEMRNEIRNMISGAMASNNSGTNQSNSNQNGGNSSGNQSGNEGNRNRGGNR